MHAAVPSIHDLMDQLPTALSISLSGRLSKMLFPPIAIAVKGKTSLHPLGKGVSGCSKSSQGYLHSPTICHGLAAGEFGKMELPCINENSFIILMMCY